MADAGGLLAKSDNGSNFEIEQNLDLDQLDAEDSDDERDSQQRVLYLEGRSNMGDNMLQVRGQPGN